MAQQVHGAEPLPSLTHTWHGASWPSGQLVGLEGGVQAQSYSLPVHLPFCGTRWLWQFLLTGQGSSLPGCW